MEDEFACLVNVEPGHSFFAIFDGHGGKNVAEFCRKRSHEIYFEVLQTEPTATQEQRWQITYQRLDEEIKERLSGPDIDCEGATSTTIHLKMLQPGKYQVSLANVGDSRAVLVNETSINDLTEAHRPSTESELRRVQAAGGKVTGDRHKRLNGRLAVTRALGDHLVKSTSKGLISIPYVHDTLVLDKTSNSAIIMASDGLWDVVSDQEVASILRSKDKYPDAQACAEKLASLAVTNKSTDNIAVVVIRIQ